MTSKTWTLPCTWLRLAKGEPADIKCDQIKAGFPRKQLPSCTIMPLCFPSAQPTAYTFTETRPQTPLPQPSSPCSDARAGLAQSAATSSASETAREFWEVHVTHVNTRISSGNFWQSNRGLQTPPEGTRPPSPAQWHAVPRIRRTTIIPTYLQHLSSCSGASN